MAAHQKLHPDQFPVPGPVFHGSPHGFAPGDTVEPRVDRNFSQKAAFGTTFRDSAAYFGAQEAQRQGRLFSSVYEVEPKSQYDLHPSESLAHGGTPPADTVNFMPIDREGFNVKRHVAYAFPAMEGHPIFAEPTIQETPHGAGEKD